MIYIAYFYEANRFDLNTAANKTSNRQKYINNKLYVATVNNAVYKNKQTKNEQNLRQTNQKIKQKT